MKNLILLLLFSALLITSCRTAKSGMLQEPVIVNHTDSVRTERIETVTIDTITVYVELPGQSVSVVRVDSASHLETDFALSDAWINGDGTLGHNLFNKARKISADVLVPTKTIENNTNEQSIKEVPVPYPQPVYVEKNLTKWQQFKIDAFWYLAGFVFLALGWTFRKRLISLFSAFS